MELQGTFRVRAPREEAFAFFLNPDDLSACVDDPHTLEIVSPDRFRGTVRAGVGFIKGTFTWTAAVAERSPPARARLQVHGSGMGSAFDADATIELSESDGATEIRWRADVRLSGPIATMGARIMGGTLDKKTAAFFENARKKLEGA